MKNFLFFLLLLPVCLLGQPKNGELSFSYSALTIPDSIKKEAHAVVRLDEALYDVSAPGKYQAKYHEIITLLDKDAEGHLLQRFGIDKFRRMDDIEIRVYNSLGVEIKKYRKKDFEIISAYDGISLVTDDKIMVLRIPSPGYPCTIEVKADMEVSSYIQLPTWLFQSPNQTVETCRLEVRIPEGMELRFKPGNIQVEPRITNEPGKKKFFWEVRHLKAFEPEPGSAAASAYPLLMLATSQFEYDGNRGDMTSWKGMGIWYNDLVKNTNLLSDKNASEIRKLINGIDNNREKVKVLYDYLQHNFRYVSIQLGIGGFKPFPADFVHEKKYGDCKALSNYMQACLQAAGIKSYSAWINAGYEKLPVDPDFPYDGFNHQILCIPIDKDTLWLECTSNVVDFGHLGNFTENKNALLLTESGGKVERTPRSSSKDNKLNSFTSIQVNPDGTGSSETLLTSCGEFKYEQVYVSKEKADDQKSYFIQEMGFPNADIFELEIGERHNRPLQTRVKLEFEKIHDFAAGSKMFLKPRLSRIWTEKLPETEKRTQEFLFEYPFIKTDTTLFIVPEGYTVEVLPAEKNLSCTYGRYISRYWYDADKRIIFSTAGLELSQNQIPAKLFEETRQFFEEVNKEGSQKIVIKKL